MDEIISPKRMKNDSNAHLNEMPVEIREQLVETAVKFLQNPKVRKSPLSQKRSFLEVKGLTPSEIEASIARVCDNDQKNGALQSETCPHFTPAVYSTYSVGVSRWSLIRDYCATIAFIGGVAYGVYHLVKTYLLPYLIGVPTHHERLTKLEMQMAAFNSTVSGTMSQLIDAIAELHEILQQINKKQDVVVASQATNSDTGCLETQFGELHSEIASLKGLLLNRHQFPATPSILPIIPTWQLSGDSSAAVVASQSATVVNGGNWTTDEADQNDPEIEKD